MLAKAQATGDNGTLPTVISDIIPRTKMLDVLTSEKMRKNRLRPEVAKKLAAKRNNSLLQSRPFKGNKRNG